MGLDTHRVDLVVVLDAEVVGLRRARNVFAWAQRCESTGKRRMIAKRSVMMVRQHVLLHGVSLRGGVGGFCGRVEAERSKTRIESTESTWHAAMMDRVRPAFDETRANADAIADAIGNDLVDVNQAIERRRKVAFRRTRTGIRFNSRSRSRLAVGEAFRSPFFVPWPGGFSGRGFSIPYITAAFVWVVALVLASASASASVV